MKALILVDMQEDFCPPQGSLAVAGGRDIAPLINSLLGLFPVCIATQDWHPKDHVSFASTHGRNPGEGLVTITNPSNPNEKKDIPLWPDHCIQGSPGAELIPEIRWELVGKELINIKKGTLSQCEMYSAFYAPFSDPKGFGDTGLTQMLRDKQVDEVWVVGLAADYCVKHTAEDAVKEGFTTYMIEEATRAVDPAAWEATGREEVIKAGVNVVSIKGDEAKSLGWSQDRVA